MRRRLRACGATACATGALALFAVGSGPGDAGAQASDQAAAGSAAAGQRLFEAGCAECHGEDARGIAGVAPSLHGAGAAAADFYLRTGRMPLADPSDQPLRTDPAYDASEIADLVAYIAGLGGPQVPHPDPAAGDLSEGEHLFSANCAGCHQIVTQGGITTEGVAPNLSDASATDIAEAVEIGPYVMPRFPQLTAHQIDSIAAYVAYAQHPDDVGGWSLGHLGPVPEGMVAWLLAGAALLLVIRLLGERDPR